jgi:hypothetical protein
MAENINKVVLHDKGFDNTSQRELMKAGLLRKVFDDTAKTIPVFYKKLVKEVKTNDEWNRDRRKGGILPFTAKLADGQNIPMSGDVLGGYVQYNLARYGLGFRITAWAEKYTKAFDPGKELSASLRKAMTTGKDITVHKMFNSPTGTTGDESKGFDQLALAHATHTGLLVGSTDDNYSNYLNADFSYTSLASIRYYYTTKVDAIGQLMMLEPDLLVFNPTLWPTVKEILGSDHLAGEISNTINPYKGFITPYEDPRLTSTTAWFALAKKDDNFDLNVFTGQEADFVSKDAPDNTRDKIYTSEAHFTYGHGDAASYYCGKL